MAVYKQAPLPFTGQKRNFLKHFTDVLNENISGSGEGWTIIDAFGGSGLLSHTAKRVKPAARVIYNDFDGYAERLKNIPDTNRLRRTIAAILSGQPKNGALSPAVRAAVTAAIQSFDGYIDLAALTAWLEFSGRQPKDLNALLADNFYNRIRKNDYPEAGDYLDGLEITHENYRDLLPQFINQPRTLLVLDPPYTCTQQGAYHLNDYFGMTEFLRLMQFVRPPFIFFSSTRSELLDYLEFVITEKQPGWERFAGYKKRQIMAPVNKDTSYEDNLIFKF